MIATQLELLPLPPLEKEEEKKDLKIYLAPEEIDRVISCCQSFRDKLIVRLLWRTGLRISELPLPSGGGHRL